MFSSRLATPAEKTPKAGQNGRFRKKTIYILAIPYAGVLVLFRGASWFFMNKTIQIIEFMNKTFKIQLLPPKLSAGSHPDGGCKDWSDFAGRQVQRTQLNQNLFILSYKISPNVLSARSLEAGS